MRENMVLSFGLSARIDLVVLGFDKVVSEKGRTAGREEKLCVFACLKLVIRHTGIGGAEED